MISAECTDRAEFILVHQISEKGRADMPHLIAIKEIISVMRQTEKFLSRWSETRRGKSGSGSPSARASRRSSALFGQ